MAGQELEDGAFHECQSPTNPPPGGWEAAHRVRRVKAAETVDCAAELITNHLEVVLCSYASPEVFEKFIESNLMPQAAELLRRLMHAVGGMLPQQERAAFGEALLGRHANNNNFSTRGPRQGGCVRSDSKMLLEFLQRNKWLCELLAATQRDPSSSAALEAATNAWHREHPPTKPTYAELLIGEDEHVAARVRIVDGKTRVRGSCLPALRRNRPPDCEALAAFTQLYTALEASTGTFRLGDEIARPQLAAIAQTDPRLPPRELIESAGRVASDVVTQVMALFGVDQMRQEAETRAAKDLVVAAVSVHQLRGRYALSHLGPEEERTRGSLCGEELAARDSLLREAEAAAADGWTVFHDCSEAGSPVGVASSAFPGAVSVCYEHGQPAQQPAAHADPGPQAEPSGGHSGNSVLQRLRSRLSLQGGAPTEGLLQRMANMLPAPH
eukprot:TRINITY_DN69950_c0_g1_i1.p1 TRINITY_DN69950_c0_g1~~TRINITY_DN69950_c0_g1_i1.p1  ORF type:complete len:485 (+),score=84.76 TRINITY_DN69950_c0_g1_i1:134-1456(+)